MKVSHNCPYSWSELKAVKLPIPPNGTPFTDDEIVILNEITTGVDYQSKIKGNASSINWRTVHTYYEYKSKWALKSDSSKKLYLRNLKQIQQKYKDINKALIKKSKSNSKNISNTLACNSQPKISSYLVTSTHE
jgi:hypothetical protein